MVLEVSFRAARSSCELTATSMHDASSRSASSATAESGFASLHARATSTIASRLVARTFG
jgi:hypothetical protein